jgi:phage terminase large subunit GpA-like protein
LENSSTNYQENQGLEPLEEVISQAFSVFESPPEMTVSEFADSERHLSSESSAMVGLWDTSVTEYLRGIMDAVSDPSVEEIVVMSASQCGKTEVILNTLAYHIAYDPCPCLIVMPNDSMCQSLSRDRIAPMVRDSPILKGTIAEAKSRTSGNTITHKTFRGGSLTLASAQSPANLSARSVRLVCFDEVDRFPASSGSEGDPVTLGKRRSVSYWNRKILMTSTPTIRNESRIETAYLNSDQRKFFVPCECCGEFQVLEWSNVKWQDKDPETASYECNSCQSLWTDSMRQRAVRLGEWRATGESGSIAGFHLSGLYSPFITMAQAVSEFQSAKGHPEILRAWVNTYLSESWEEESERVDVNEILERREEFADPTPEGVLVITAGVDVQADRLEALVVGHGKADEMWFLDHRIFYGSPASDDLWEELSDFLLQSFRLPNGKDLKIAQTLIDSGYETQKVYQFVKRMGVHRINASKGIGGSGRPAVGRPSKSNSARVPVFPVGTITLKDVLFSRLKVSEVGPAYWHIPEKFDAEWCYQLTAEKAVKRYTRGIPRTEYIKLRPRNEALDLTVLNLASFAMLNVNVDKVQSRLEDQRRPEPKVQPPFPFMKKKKPNWINRHK